MQTSTKINLEKATALVIDDNQQALDLLCGVLASFGLREQTRCNSAIEAKEICKRQTFDLILTDGAMPEMDGYEFVHWLRREGGDQGRLTPAIVITAHTRKSHVIKARDCGANFIIAKPITPTIILQRILWVAQASRMFIEADTYVGPDRRFKQLGPPAEFPDGRRRDDKPIELGAAQEPNMSQEELDNMIKAQKAAL